MLVFGDHRLDIARRELRCGTELIDLAPQVFDLLAYLVQHRDRVVSKDDLLEAIWDGRIVSESALTTRINAVRRALGDDGAAQRLIRTYARKGIRFVGEVMEIVDQGPASGRASNSEVRTPALPPDKPSLAVLPFQNLTGDPEQDYFVDGMVEEITTAIARFPRLLVIARNARLAIAKEGQDAATKQEARELGARYLLEGSVRKAGTRIRITGELIESRTGVCIWRERFDGTLGDIFELQDRVASGVAGAIEPELRLAEIARANGKPTDSLDAYDLYLRGLAKCHERMQEGVAEGVSLLQRALELDPGYAPAMAVISGLRCLQRNRHWIPEDGIEVEQAIQLARRAIASDTDDPDVLTTAGYALAFLAGDNEAAFCAIDRATVLNSNYAVAFGERALVLAFLNRPDEAIASAQQALRLSPRDPKRFMFVLALALANLAAGRYEAALPWAEEALRENAGLPALRLKLSICGHLGRLDEARECLRRLPEICCEPTVASLMRGASKGIAPPVIARLVEGLRMAGVPER